MRVKCLLRSALTLGVMASSILAVPGESHAGLKKRSEAQWDQLAGKRYRMKAVRLQRFSTSSIALAVTQAGNQPDGFGKVVDLSEFRSQKEVVVTAFINTADSLGVKVSGLKKGDSIQIESARGLATFAGYDQQREALSSLAGVVSVGIGSAKPETAPFMKEVKKFADSLIKLIPSAGKTRDSFGKEPGSGYKRKEGGVLVCLPLSGGAYYAGEIKTGGKRYDNKRPSYVKNAFFPIRVDPDNELDRGHNTRTVRKDGSLIMLAWDSNFKDNAGVYEVDVRITFASGTSSDDVQPTRLPTFTLQQKNKPARFSRRRATSSRLSSAKPRK